MKDDSTSVFSKEILEAFISRLNNNKDLPRQINNGFTIGELIDALSDYPLDTLIRIPHSFANGNYNIDLELQIEDVGDIEEGKVDLYVTEVDW